MKLVIPIFIVGILLLISFGAGALNVEKENNFKTVNSVNQNSGPRDYTHTVFVEVATGQFCGPCHNWNTNIYNTYSSGQYDFEYVEMVIYGFGGWSDILNTKANSWRALYGINAVPWSIMDGNYQNIVGNYPDQLLTKLNNCGNRAVADIDADMIVTWLGSATIKIDIEIKNNQATQYNGYIRVPITEIVSRYLTSGGAHYHFGFLDYAFNMNTAISIPAGGTYTNSVTWDGKVHQDNHGNNFADITSDNTKVILGVFNNNGYIDETVAATPGSGANNPPDPPRYPYPSDGGTNIPVNIQISWTGSDPDNDDLTYDVYFGTTSPPPKIVSNQSETSYAPENLVNLTTYYWQIVAWDEHGESTAGTIWSFTTTSNYPPDKPNITGPPSGKVGEDLEYTFIATDPNGDSLYYYISWGDGSAEEWIGPLPSGEELNATHQWSKSGPYSIKAKVKDQGAESSYAMLEITIPRYRLVIPSLVQKLLGRLQIFQILQNFLQ